MNYLIHFNVFFSSGAPGYSGRDGQPGPNGPVGPKVINLHLIIHIEIIFFLCRVMLVILANQVHQVVLVQWVILAHQVQHFQVKEERRVFLVQSVRIDNLFLTISLISFFFNQTGIPGPHGAPGPKGEPGMYICLYEE